MRPYNTAEGISAYLAQGLAGFNHLIYLRREAGYQRHESLNEFCVLGRWFLDTSGNTWKIGSDILMDMILNFPDVVDVRDVGVLQKIIIPDDLGDISLIMVMSMHPDIPRADIICSVCGKGWTIKNCHDVTLSRHGESFPLQEFIGRTLGDVRTAFARRTDAEYFMQVDILIIRNDRFIDLSPKYPNPKNDWEKRMVKNAHGWVSECDGITDAYTIQSGDNGFFYVWKYFHKACFDRKNRVDAEAYFRDIFEEAGFKDSRFAPTELFYPYSALWFNAYTTLGTILVGWSNNPVGLYIDWSSIPASIRNHFLNLFKSEGVTEDPCISARTREKAIEYLKTIRIALKPDTENIEH